jgi:hypothetical protein
VEHKQSEKEKKKRKKRRKFLLSGSGFDSTQVHTPKRAHAQIHDAGNARPNTREEINCQRSSCLLHKKKKKPTEAGK